MIDADLIARLRKAMDAEARWVSDAEDQLGGEGVWDWYVDTCRTFNHHAFTEHMQRYTPARVRERIAADREILDLWAAAEEHRHLPEGVRDGRDPDERERDVAVAEALDAVVEVLAQAYRVPGDSTARQRRCIHHGTSDCPACSRNPSTCAPDHDGPPGCGYYAATGMHWDTCVNRVDG